MAIIKSGATSDQLTVDATSKAARTTLYNSAGTEITNSNPLPTSVKTGRTFVGDYAVTTFQTNGLVSNPHNLFSIWNPAASGKNLAIKRLVLQIDHSSLFAGTIQVVTSHPTAQPSGGTALTSVKFAASYAAAIALPLGATASDAGAATAITATGGTYLWAKFAQRSITMVGWFTIQDTLLLPEQTVNTPILIAPGDGLLVNTVSNANTGTAYVINCWWEEYT